MKLNKSELIAKIRALQREIDGLMDLVISLDEPEIERIVQVQEADDWMTAKQTCKRLKISETTFYEYVKAGLLPKGYEFGPKSKRWRMSDILSWQISKAEETTKQPKTITRRRSRVSRVRKLEEFMNV